MNADPRRLLGPDRGRRSVSPCQVLGIFWIILLVACAPQPATPTPTARPTPTATPLPPADTTPVDVLPAPEALPGWRLEGDPKRYDTETLYDLVNGAADLYFTYGFESVTVGQYVDEGGRTVQVEVYDTASDADAYGLYTYHSFGKPLDLGIEGELEAGYRLAFWQGRRYVQIVARETVDDDTLRAFGRAVASALPPGGQRPGLVDVLPAEGLQPGSVRFFREKMALDNLLWLGNDDVLGLGREVEGIVARYAREGQEIDLLLVALPDPQRAEQARAGLEGAGLDTLAAAGVQGNILGAVFGAAVPEETARGLLEQALAASEG